MNDAKFLKQIYSYIIWFISTEITQGEIAGVAVAGCGDGVREEVEPQLTCLIVPRGQHVPPHGGGSVSFSFSTWGDADLTFLVKKGESGEVGDSLGR